MTSGVTAEIIYSRLWYPVEKLAKRGQLERHIVGSIGPRMSLRRGRESVLNADQRDEKVFSNRPGKPGELSELRVAYRNAIEAGGMTAELAGELADFAYYGTGIESRRHIIEAARSVARRFKLNIYDVQMFCVLKYEARLRFGDLPKIKDLEPQILEMHIRSSRFFYHPN